MSCGRYLLRSNSVFKFLPEDKPSPPEKVFAFVFVCLFIYVPFRFFKYIEIMNLTPSFVGTRLSPSLKPSDYLPGHVHTHGSTVVECPPTPHRDSTTRPESRLSLYTVEGRRTRDLQLLATQGPACLLRVRRDFLGRGGGEEEKP